MFLIIKLCTYSTVVLYVHVALRATYRSKFLVDMLVQISLSTLRCSTYREVGEKVIRTSLGFGWVGRQPTIPVLLAGQLIQYVRCACSSLSSCRAASTDIPDPLSPLLPIIHRFWLVLKATSRILTELLYVGSSWSSCFC